MPYRVAQKKLDKPISLQIFWKLNDRIAWKLVNFCNVICWTQTVITFLFKNFIALYVPPPSENSYCVMLKFICTVWVAPQRDEIFKHKVNDCVQHIILQKSTNFHAIRSWSFRNICNEIGWSVTLFCVTLYIGSRSRVFRKLKNFLKLNIVDSLKITVISTNKSKEAQMELILNSLMNPRW